MKKIMLSISLIISSLISAQNTYVDVTTTLALKNYADQMKTAQNKQAEELKNIERAKIAINAQLYLVEHIQSQVLKGLSEVSGTVSNAIQVKNIGHGLIEISTELANVGRLVRDKPQYAVFGRQSAEKAYEFAISASTEMKSLLQSGDLNLATAGDRFRLLNELEWKVKGMREWIFSIRYNLERAIRLGFWKAINPFQGYINTDKDIVQNIMLKYKHNF